MVQLSDQDREMLASAMKKARHLVEELEKQQREIEASPPDLPADDLARGKEYFANAVASARRTLAALIEAAEMVQPPIT
jgi:hypothetical protein